MNGEKWIEHCLDGLRYRLTTGPVALRPLRALAEREIRWRDWRVRFLALGTSHAVLLARGGQRLTELLSCAAPESDASRLCLLEAGAARAALSAAAFGLHCRVTLSPFSLDAGDGLETAFATDSQMQIAYPAALGKMAPVTRIGWIAAPQELLVETVHTYPQEGRGLRSRTYFTLANEAFSAAATSELDLPALDLIEETS